ncbi:hypothetical protein [Azotobacter chroococcum]|uniref:hypothetical protein n=1 Tax=Azotobacter chroococcum TaxID=353 RepID=UPI001396BCB5|nr:hypothetical protein [Azotobacter chroococcum]
MYLNVCYCQGNLPLDVGYGMCMFLSLLHCSRLQLVQGDVVGFHGRAAAGGFETVQQSCYLGKQDVQLVDEALMVGSVHCWGSTRCSLEDVQIHPSFFCVLENNKAPKGALLFFRRAGSEEPALALCQLTQQG